MKKPCIATNTGGIPEVYGDTNILIPPNDPFKLKENENFKNEQALKGFERAKSLFSSDINFKSVMDVYGALLDKKSMMQK